MLGENAKSAPGVLVDWRADIIDLVSFTDFNVSVREGVFVAPILDAIV